MFSSVCQGLQLCLEPRIVESHFLRLKLAPPSSFQDSIETPTPCFTNPSEPEPISYHNDYDDTDINITDGNNNSDNISKQNADMGVWSFLQSLAGPKDSTENNEVYVHPLVKSSASALSKESLEMCTESLGSETGSDISDDITFGCYSPSKHRENSVTRRMSYSRSFPPHLTSISGSNMSYNPLKTRENLVMKRMSSSSSSSFPPPLTSISGSNGVQVTSHREGGRLVLQAVNVPSCQTYFHVERSEGRLRLCLLKETTADTPIFDDKEEEEEEEGEEVTEEDEVVEEGEVLYEENDVVEEDEVLYGENGVVQDENDVVEDEVLCEENDILEDIDYEENGAVEDEVEEEKCYWGVEDLDEKNGNIGDQIGNGKLARLISCKGNGCGHKGLLDWEPYLVAT
ncbi:protein FANTASTIC FOUR 1-like [Gossypium arboreum]|uniref:protein FANTASTIC FOUR 1-like n=1 Tax=Gossypium arboreum TaxID=29729 RepID=UPI000819242A|nr:protein FANTASTIC FOUR 1-like [Gossypium arboreum]